MPVINRIADFHADMTAWRRDLHQYPELALQETRTSQRVQELLRSFGVDEVHAGIARTGVVGVIHGQAPGEGIGLRAYGQQDPLVEYRRRGQLLFDELQITLRHDVVRALYSAMPVDSDEAERLAETDLTRAARHSVENVDQINAGESEFEETDFARPADEVDQKKKADDARKRARKTERKRKAAGRKRK